jgi:hypothetical protein
VSPFESSRSTCWVYGLDFKEFGDWIQRTLGFSESNGSAYSSLGLREIGVYAAVAAPVYLSMARSAALLRELAKLLAFVRGPFVLLTPTGSSWRLEAEAMARPDGAATFRFRRSWRSCRWDLQVKGYRLASSFLSALRDDQRWSVSFSPSNTRVDAQTVDSSLALLVFGYNSSTSFPLLFSLCICVVCRDLRCVDFIREFQTWSG